MTAYDPGTGKTSAQTVEHVWVNHDADLLDVTLASDGGSAQPQTDGAMSKQHEVAVASHGRRAPPPAKTSAAGDETIRTTQKHPWLTADRGWAPAGELHVGERVVREGGTLATVVALRARPGAADYYNLTVARLHTYAVGAGRYVVHNANRFGGKSGNTPAAQIGQDFHGDRLNGGAPDNYGGPSQLQDIYPNTDFKFKPNGAAGPDVEVIGGQHPSTYGRGNWPAGANIADFKPATRQGKAEMRSQMRHNPARYPAGLVVHPATTW